MVEFRLLGQVEVWAGGRQLETGSPQQRAVLAALLVDAGRVVTVPTLVDRVWGEQPIEGARRALHAHISRIRQLLRHVEGDGVAPVRLLNRSGGYLLDIDTDLVDWHRFRRLVGAAGSEPDPAQRLRQALDLWRGAPLANVPGDWAARTRERWRERQLDTTVSWAEAELRAGRHHDLIGPVRDRLDEHPLAEPLVAVLMRALATTGRAAEALHCYAATRTRLVEELGVAPGPELQALHQAILRGQVPPGRGDGPPRGETRAHGDRPALGDRPARGETPAQLPADVRGFAGRVEHIARLNEILEEAAAETTAIIISAVSGTAGVGKTALALRWAHRVRARFPDGQLYLNLRGFDPAGRVMTPADAVRVLLDSLGVAPERIPPDPDAQAGLYRSLMAGRRMLVVLDNARDAEQVRPLLPGTVTSVVVVTSRNQLTALVAGQGAHPLVLDVLSDGEARQLLANRLGAERVAAEPDAVEKIIAVCARLPLALTIAAARAQHGPLPLSAIAEELREVDQRLDALDAGDITSQVRAAFSWSYGALSPPAARLFRLLGLHPGPDISAAAAASLADAPIAEVRRHLRELVSASLLTEHSPVRYTQHDLLRVYAADLVRTDRQRQAATSRMLDHYVHAAHEADRLLNPHRDRPPMPLDAAAEVHVEVSDGTRAMEWLNVERAVLLAVLQYAAERGHHAHAWHLAWAIDIFLDRRGLWPERAAAWLVALDAAERLADPRAQAYAHGRIAQVYRQLDRLADAHTHLQHALHQYVQVGDTQGEADTHLTLVRWYEREGLLDQALHHAEHAVALFQTTEDRRGEALALNMIGWFHILRGEHRRAVDECQKALVLLQKVGDRSGEAATWDSLGLAHHHLGDLTLATECYDRAIGLYRDLVDHYNVADTFIHLGDMHRAEGNHRAAGDAWREALAILTDLGHPDAEDVRSKLDAPG